MNRMPTMLHAGVALAILCVGPAQGQGQGMYQWKDAQGRTHLSDKPPPGVDSPTRVTPRASNVVPADTAAKGLAASRTPAEAPAAPASAASATTAGTAQAARPGETDCQRRQREYQASMACFAPLRNAAGAIAPEAAKKCGPAMAEPPPC
ncbi:DUF4124 domain-containing protein [Caenimonas sedimenti]|uniref:DUF4124 domain-containing protein n=1 Tax=Caenimonas sedimenti TaxID=2596921 RepID=A0A562ZTD6_9BURK|nr:DUF4124 domain-containing protein [Caenimonas sedimenti]TWO71869.1 DUF4124 domain-containing protein [Caenimonas sedimenti]